MITEEKGVHFEPWPKTPRLNKDMVITEKIDGTNAAVLIVPWEKIVNEVSEGWNWSPDYYRQWGGTGGKSLITVVGEPIHKSFGDREWVEYGRGAFAVFAQSRKRFVTPGSDNFGFAAWVREHAEDLVLTLGEGRHYGEWWGLGIQRRYDQPAKRFSLFNVHRYAGVEHHFEDGTVMNTVPTLYHGPFDTQDVQHVIAGLREGGSVAAPGFMKPEGVIVFHAASGHTYKAFCENDDIPKGEA